MHAHAAKKADPPSPQEMEVLIYHVEEILTKAESSLTRWLETESAAADSTKITGQEVYKSCQDAESLLKRHDMIDSEEETARRLVQKVGSCWRLGLAMVHDHHPLHSCTSLLTCSKRWISITELPASEWRQCWVSHASLLGR